MISDPAKLASQHYHQTADHLFCQGSMEDHRPTSPPERTRRPVHRGKSELRNTSSGVGYAHGAVLTNQIRQTHFRYLMRRYFLSLFNACSMLDNASRFSWWSGGAAVPFPLLVLHLGKRQNLFSTIQTFSPRIYIQCSDKNPLH